jgi:hypothetical protein
LNWFDSIKKQISALRNKENNPIFLKEQLNDKSMNTEDSLKSMQNWGFQMIDDVAISYIDFLSSNKGTQKFNFIKQNGINGFALELSKFSYNSSDWRNFQFYCKEKLLEAKYIAHVKEVSSKSDVGNLYITYKYYLKPSIRLMTEIPSVQLFGNISLDLIIKNEQPFRFLLKANYYSDRNYQKEQAFQEIFSLLRS